jgi:hypothetical protein
MKRFAFFAALVLTLALSACGSEARQEPFVGQWDSTGGSAISLVVEDPVDGEYPVRVTSGDFDLTMTAEKTSDDGYEAESTTPALVWTFQMVDDDLLNSTVEGGGDSGTTSFKRIGG